LPDAEKDAKSSNCWPSKIPRGTVSFREEALFLLPAKFGDGKHGRVQSLGTAAPSSWFDRVVQLNGELKMGPRRANEQAGVGSSEKKNRQRSAGTPSVLYDEVLNGAGRPGRKNRRSDFAGKGQATYFLKNSRGPDPAKTILRAD